jgi:hypothetical protein
MTNIDDLSPEQINKFPEFITKWTAIGLNCDPVNVEETREAIKEAYVIADETPPPDDKFYHVKGPLEGVELLLKLKKMKDTVSHRASILSDFIYGSHDAGWLAFHDFFYEVCNVPYKPEIKPIMTIARNCGWWAPYDEAVVMMDRHEEVHINEDKQLHNMSGPAVRYRDGFEIYAVRGIVIPKEWITGPMISATDALHWANVEQRIIACEIIGWDNILDGLSHKVLDEDPDPEIGTLIEVDIPESGKEKFLKVRCGTGRTIYLKADPDAKTALEANAASYQYRAANFKPEVRT